MKFCIIDLPRPGSMALQRYPLEVQGWCFFEDEPVHFVEIYLDNKLLEVKPLNHPRPDVEAAHPESKAFGMPLGFEYVINLPEDAHLGNHTLSIVALNDKGRREFGRVVEFELRESVVGSTLNYSERFALLPHHVIRKVNGHLTEATFVERGQGIAAEIIEAIPGVTTNANQIFDFGCGLGRVLGPLLEKAPQANFIGFDIDPQMLRWADFLLQAAQVQFTSSTLPFTDNSFDLIYAVSVFTHLNATSDYWLAEIHRLVKPEGRAFITYMDETLFAEVADKGELPGVVPGTRLGQEPYIIGEETTEGGLAMGIFYPTSLWQSWLQPYFEIEQNVPRGLLEYQSYTVVRKKPVYIDQTRIARPYIQTLEQELFNLRKKLNIYY